METGQLQWQHHLRVMTVLSERNPFAHDIVDALVRLGDFRGLREALREELDCSEQAANLIIEQAWSCYLVLWHTLGD